MVDFCGDGLYGGRQDCIEFAEVCEVSGEVYRERVEGMGVL